MYICVTCVHNKCLACKQLAGRPAVMIYTVNKLSYGRDGASRGPTDLRRSLVGGRAGGRGVGRIEIGLAGGSGWRWIGNRRGAHYIILLQRWSGMRASGPRPVGTRTFYYFIVPVLYIIFCTFYFHFTATTVQRIYVSSSSSSSAFTAAAAAATAEYTTI